MFGCLKLWTLEEARQFFTISARAGGWVELRYIGTWPGNWEGFKLRRMIKLLKFDAQAIQYIIFYAATFIHKLDNYSCIQHAKFVGLHLCHLRGLTCWKPLAVGALRNILSQKQGSSLQGSKEGGNWSLKAINGQEKHCWPWNCSS